MISNLLEMLTLTKLTLLLLIFLITNYIYKRVMKPYYQFSYYSKLLTPIYKTKISPFYIIGTFNIRNQKKDIQKYGDSHYRMKYQYRDYQVIVNHFHGKIFIDLIQPNLIRQFYQKTLQGCYVKFTGFPFLSSLKSIIGNGLLFSEGQEWKKKRRIMSNVFNYDFIKGKIPSIADICSSTLDQLENQACNQGKGEITADVLNVMQKIFGNVVIKCFFGDIQLENIDGEPVFTFLNRFMEQNTERSMTLWAFALGDNFFKWNLRKIDRQMNRQKELFEEYCRNLIENHIKKSKNEQSQADQKGHRGILDMFLTSNQLKNTEEGKKEGDFYTKQELIDQFKTFFMAGTDTTANSTTILIYQLAKNPKVLEKVRKQIEENIGKDMSKVNFESLKKLKYLQQVLKENLRMYGPTAGIFQRQVVKDHYIGQIPIKKGMLVSIKMKANHFKQQFFKNADIFSPERWEDIDSSKADPFSFFPFSSGQRNCIGQHLAFLESKVAVIAILQRYKTIKLQKEEFRYYFKTLYGAEKMNTVFIR